jgi:hypothetical protein
MCSFHTFSHYSYLQQALDCRTVCICRLVDTVVFIKSSGSDTTEYKKRVISAISSMPKRCHQKMTVMPVMGVGVVLTLIVDVCNVFDGV